MTHRPKSNKLPTVLIVDDDPAVLAFVSARCAAMGFRTLTAANGLQALIISRQQLPDMLIVDHRMPELDGMSLCERLIDPTNTKRDIDVIFMTGYADAEAVDRCESFGAVYVRKGPELWDIMKSALLESFPEMADAADNVEPFKARGQVRARPRILIVDEDPTVGDYLTGRLRKCGVETLLAPSGAKGYQMARRERPSVIIAEYALADGDASYLLSRLRSTPETECIPVLIMTRQRLDETVKDGLKKNIRGRTGAARIFDKPLDINELFPTLQEYCALEYSAA